MRGRGQSTTDPRGLFRLNVRIHLWTTPTLYEEVMPQLGEEGRPCQVEVQGLFCPNIKSKFIDYNDILQEGLLISSPPASAHTTDNCYIYFWYYATWISIQNS